MNEPDEWVTVAECARRLGIDQKQVRRYAGRLADTDRTPADTSPMSVRLSAVVSIRKRSTEREISRRSPVNRPPDTDRTLADSQQDMSAQNVRETLAALQAQYEHQLADKSADIAFLRQELEAGRIERAELRRLLLIEQDAVKRLTSAPPATVDPPEERPLAVAVDDQDLTPLESAPAPGTADRPTTTDQSPGRGTEPPKRGFWQKVLDVLLFRESD